MARILSLPFHCDQKVWCMPPSTGDWYDWYQSPTFGTVFFDSIMQFYFALIHFWIHFFFELKFDIEGFVFVWISHVFCICRRFIYPSMVWIIKSDYSQGFILIPIRTQLLFGTVLRGPFASLGLYGTDCEPLEITFSYTWALWRNPRERLMFTYPHHGSVSLNDCFLACDILNFKD